MDALKKVFQIELKKDDIDEEESTLLATVSSEKRDRDGEIIRLSKESVDLEGYRKNPVLLWNHRVDDPIGKAVWIKPDKKTLIAKFRFHRKTQRSKEIYELYKTGFLNSFSISFLPKIPKDNYKVYRSIEILEVSCVSLPSNTDAIVQNGYGQKISDGILRKDLSLEAIESPSAIFNPDVFAAALKQAMNPDAVKEIVDDGLEKSLSKMRDKLITVEKEDRLIEISPSEIKRLVDKNILEWAMEHKPELAKRMIDKQIKTELEIAEGKMRGKVF